MHILLLLVILEDGFKHILRSGDFLCTFITDMAHSCLDERRFEFFIVAVLHIPQHERREDVFLFQTFQSIRIHAASGDQNQSACFSNVT